MNTPCIDRVLRIHGWSLQSWNDRYSKGVWVAIAPSNSHLEEVRDSTSAGDLDMETSGNFLLESQLLPITVASSFGKAVEALEARLSALSVGQINNGSAWVKAVRAEYDYFCKALQNSGDYGSLRLRDPVQTF